MRIPVSIRSQMQRAKQFLAIPREPTDPAVLENLRTLALAVQRLESGSAEGKHAPEEPATRSRMCTYDQLTTDWFKGWCAAMRRAPQLHRKLWEFAFIAEALDARSMLQPGRRGLGFGVGTEPLAALFASRGVEVVATDQPPLGASAAAWGSSGQHAGQLADLNMDGICPAADFSRLVSFRPVDMLDVPGDLRDFDFVWSACAFEHLGSLEAGMSFVEASVDCLGPGGVAVHTTEFNVSSNTDTITAQNLVVYRRRDIDELVDRLRSRGLSVDDVDFDPGDRVLDRFVDLPPFGDEPHIKRTLGQFTITSIGLIAERGQPPATRR